jgi:thiol-disulfide isomerase/thioredoxin
LAVASLALFAALARPAAAQDQIGLPLGTSPQPVQIEDLQGATVDLGEHYGNKPVLLEFWATWCPQCKALEPELEAAHARFGEDVEFLIVAVAVNQSLRRVRRHVEDHEMPGRMLWDGEGAAVRTFEAPTTSYVVILDGEGKVAYTGVGGDQEIEAALAKVVGR